MAAQKKQNTPGETFLPTQEGQPASLIVDLMMSKFDELVELDFVHGRMRNLHHVDGKYFVPVVDATIRDIRRYSAENMVHPDDLELYLRETDPSTLQQRIETSETPGKISARFRYKLLNGGWCWVEQITVGGEQNGMPAGVYYSFIYDVQEQVERENGKKQDETESCNFRSELTGLLVEESFFDRVRTLAREHPEGWCIVAIDLEHFKLFNEWYGRKHGDLLLAQIGAKLTQMEKKLGGISCYFGQDDFGLMAPLNMEDLEALYADIHELIKKFGTSVGFMPAFGICVVDERTAAEELYDRAALAARYAKENYHTRIRSFEPAMYQQTERDYQILSDFQNALKSKELFFVLQPQCKISSRKIVGAESLVRWRKKLDGELVSPGLFVPILEKYGFITDLDKYVWEEVCKWQRKWIDDGHTPLPISVNVSQIDIYTIDVPAFFEELIETYHLPVSSIKIEITESAYVDNDAVADTVQRLRAKGLMVLMDDFGSGYSSLNMLRNLNVDIIKLDAQFLRMNNEDRKGIHIMESIVNMAKTMGVPIIVEGVETRKETTFLASLGCHYVQGYYFYRPMLPEEFEKLISDPQHVDTDGFLFRAHEEFRTREFLDQNVFNDTMLNNILGPVGFFLLHGDELDVLRYNQHFYREINTPDFRDHLNSVQQLVLPEDRPKLYAMLRSAERQMLEGAPGELRIRRIDGSLLELQIRFFFMEEDESGKKFYGSVRDVTQSNRAVRKLETLSRTSHDSVLFLTQQGEHVFTQVAIHGLQDVMGLSQTALEDEINNGRFYERIDLRDRAWLRKLMTDAKRKLEAFSPPFQFETASGEKIKLRVGLDTVQDRDCGVDYLLIFRRIDE